MKPSHDATEETHRSGQVSHSAAWALNYTVIAQNAAELQDIQNAPAVSMPRFLVEHGRMGLVPTISIYGERGTDRDKARLLYMNAAALRIWKEMGVHPTEIGVQHRPARTAELVFGMPYSE
jgi:hypothetical protein